MPGPLLALAIFVAVIGVPAATGSFWSTIFALAAVLMANPVIRQMRKRRYFASDEFQSLRAGVVAVVNEHNEVVRHVQHIRDQGAFALGSSASGQHAHLASFDNTSSWNYRRDRNVAQYAPHVHNASLQVVRNASADPLKYVMKYFSIKADQETLADVQRVAEDISRLEAAVANVSARESDITTRVKPPAFVLKHYAHEFWAQVGAELSAIQVPYPQYVFQYTSAGGNSGQTTKVELNTPTLDALSGVLVEKIRWAKSAAGQRALMTSRLREFIKQRDNHTCQHCGISSIAEPHLLLEVDHVVPVSKGGLSVPENLQALCWRCNRTKGAKVLA